MTVAVFSYESYTVSLHIARFYGRTRIERCTVR